MKQTSKDKIINQSLADKIEIARDLKRQEKYWEAIQAYHKDPHYMIQLAEIYQRNYDISSAALFYRRVHQLNNSTVAKQKIKLFAKIQGLQLLYIGSIKNILEDTEFEPFIKRYPFFQKRLMKKIAQKTLVSDYLQNSLAYLQVNQRQYALDEVDSCLMIEQNNADLVVLRALLNWSLMENAKGYLLFWKAYAIDRNNAQVQLFIEMISPELQKLYKEAKQELVIQKIEKCKLKVKKGLQIHPYHTQLLILSAYIHRKKQEYQAALSDLQLANKFLENKGLEQQLKNQISLTYNEMGIFLYKQSKYNEAITLFSEGLTFKSEDWGMLTNRGDCYKALNQYVKALQDYLKAFEIQKKNEELNFRISSIYSIRGVALFNSKNYDLSLKQFEDSINYSPKCAQFYLSKAKCLLQLENKPDAIEALQKCLSLDDKLIEASQIYNQIKQPEQRKLKNNRKIIYLSKQK